MAIWLLAREVFADNRFQLLFIYIDILPQPTSSIAIRRHDSDVYLGMSPVQNGGSYLMY